MPLINPSDPGFKQVQLQRGFEQLPETDKVNVIELIKLGKTSVNPEFIEAQAIPDLSEAGRGFIESPLFREIYDTNVNRQPPPQDNSPEINPMVRGLMEVIKNLSGGKGMLDPDNSNRIGGEEEESEDEIGNGKEMVGFESKLGDAFKKGGAKGLANTHRELLSDPRYNKFLEGGK